MSKRLTQLAPTFSMALSILGMVFSASAIISLIQRGAHVELQWGFAHFLRFYREWTAPIIELVQVPALWILAKLQIHLPFPLPQWANDLHTLSFVGAAVFVRGWANRDAAVTRLLERQQSYERNLEERDPHLSRILDHRPSWWEAMKPVRSTNAKLSFIFQGALAFLLGATGLGLFVWTYKFSDWDFAQSGDENWIRSRLATSRQRKTGTIPIFTEKGEADRTSRMPSTYADTQEQKLWVRQVATRLNEERDNAAIRLVLALAAAIAAFYIGNALLPQFIFSAPDPH